MELHLISSVSRWQLNCHPGMTDFQTNHTKLLKNWFLSTYITTHLVKKFIISEQHQNRSSPSRLVECQWTLAELGTLIPLDLYFPFFIVPHFFCPPSLHLSCLRHMVMVEVWSREQGRQGAGITGFRAKWNNFPWNNFTIFTFIYSGTLISFNLKFPAIIKRPLKYFLKVN